MYTQCPHCQAVFRVRAGALTAARGVARCGRCHREFDALATLTDTLPKAGRNQTWSAEPPLEAVDLGAPLATASADQTDLFGATAGPTPTAAPLASEVRIVRAGGGPPSFARSSAAPGESGWWWVGAALLALALGGQFAWLNRATLLGDARLLEAVEAACRRAGCELPLADDRSRITLGERDVGPHPTRPHALKITASFVNEAALPQSLPLVELVLSDVAGRRVAMRRFRPAEYLGEQALTRLDPGAEVRLDLEVEDPGGDAVAFDFSFR